MHDGRVTPVIVDRDGDSPAKKIYNTMIFIELNVFLADGRLLAPVSPYRVISLPGRNAEYQATTQRRQITAGAT